MPGVVVATAAPSLQEMSCGRRRTKSGHPDGPPEGKGALLPFPWVSDRAPIPVRRRPSRAGLPVVALETTSARPGNRCAAQGPGKGMPARDDREIGAPQRDRGRGCLPRDDREIGALQTNPGGDPLLCRDEESVRHREEAAEETSRRRGRPSASCSIMPSRLGRPRREGRQAAPGLRPRRLALRRAGLHVDAEPARPPYPLPLRGGARTPRLSTHGNDRSARKGRRSSRGFTSLVAVRQSPYRSL
jgi:hypothetical protein